MKCRDDLKAETVFEFTVAAGSEFQRGATLTEKKRFLASKDEWVKNILREWPRVWRLGDRINISSG